MGGIAFMHVVDANAEDEGHMCIVEAVENLLANAMTRDQTQRAKDTQVLGDGGLSDEGQSREIAGAQLILKEAGDNPGAGGIAECVKDGSKGTSRPLVNHPRAARRYSWMVPTRRRARQNYVRRSRRHTRALFASKQTR
jgi:hypothetical protein